MRAVLLMKGVIEGAKAMKKSSRQPLEDPFEGWWGGDISRPCLAR